MTTQTQVSEDTEFINSASPSEVIGVISPKKKRESTKRRFYNKGEIVSRFHALQERFFLNKAALYCCLLILAQQLIIASSTLWLTFLTEEISGGTSFILMLVLYLASMLIPYVPESISLVYCNNWKQGAYEKFIQRFVESRKNDPISWSNQGSRDQTVSILNAEGQATINAMVDHIYNCFYYFSSVALNIVAISVFVEVRFAFAYMVSLLCILVVMRLQNKKQAILAQKAQGARIRLGQSLLSVWDNVLLGNRYSFNLWMRQTNRRLHQSNRLNFCTALFNQWIAISIALLVFLPSFVVSIHAMYQHQSEPMMLTNIALILPRLFLVLGYTQLVLSYLAQWNVHKAKLEMIDNTLKPPQVDSKELQGRICWNKLSFSPSLPLPLNYELSLTNLLEPLKIAIEHFYPHGRYKLHGENGSGKSTLLMFIKNQIQEQAFYLPTRHQLAFFSNRKKASTGELLKRQLEEIQANVDVRVLLLDEWDANLDERNRNELSAMIDQLAQDRCVIEVRHK